MPPRTDPAPTAQKVGRYTTKAADESLNVDTTPKGPEKDMEEGKKVDILLFEYGSIQNWVNTRVSNFYQILSIGPPALAIVASNFQFGWMIAISLSGVGLMIFLLWHAVTDVRRARKRLLDLETQINARAGEELIMLQSKLGGRVVSNWYPTLFGLSKEP